MNKLRIIANDNELDFSPDQDAPLAISVGIAELSDIKRRRSTGSKPFKLPATEQNAKAFEHLNDPNIDPDTVADIAFGRTDCRIEVDSNLWLDGYIRARSFSYGLQPLEIEAEIYGGNNDWISQVADAQMNELDYAQNVEYTRSNITAVNSNATAGYCFPLIDYGGIYGVSAVNVTDFAPGFFMDYALESIFEGIGYTIESDWLGNSDVGDVIFTGGVPVMQALDPWSFQPTGSYNVVHNSVNFNEQMNFQGGGIEVDPDNQISSGINFLTFSPAYSQYGYWEIQFDISGYNPPRGSTFVELNIFDVSGSLVHFQTIDGSLTLTGGGTSGSFTGQSTVNVYDVGTSYRPELKATVSIGDTATIYNAKATFISVAAAPIAGCALNIPASMPNMTQLEFVQMCKDNFNLFIDADPTTRKVRIEPRNDWYDTSGTKVTGYLKGTNDAVDWTDKALVDPPIKGQFLTGYRDRLTFIHEEGDDWHFEEYEGINNRQMGEFRYTFPKAYQPGETKIEAKGGTAVMRYHPTIGADGQTLMPVLLNDEPGNQTAEVSKLPRFFVFKYEELINRFGQSSSYRFNDDTGANAVNLTFIPRAWTVDLDNETRLQTTFASYGEGEGLVERFWNGSVLDARYRVQFTGEFNLTDSDVLELIQRFGLRNPVYIDGAGYFYVQKVVDYRPGQDEPVKVELVKVRGGRIDFEALSLDLILAFSESNT